jgi:DNA repair exonuclease SbcCD ATPase subunit
MRIGIPLLATMLGLLIGFSAGFLYQQPAVRSAEERVAEISELLHETEAPDSRATAQPAEIEVSPQDGERLEELESLRADLAQSEEHLQLAQGQIEEMERELDRQQAQHDDLQELADALWDYRRILIELNRGFPADDEEFEAHVERLAELTVRSFPQLSREANDVVAAVPGYLQWQQELTEEEVLVMAYIYAGAMEFNEAFRDFEQAILRAVVEHLETAVEGI